MLYIVQEFLRNKILRVVISDQFSSWAEVEAGFPQGSMVGPLLFLIHVNYISSDLMSNPKLFADDTSIFLVIKDVAVTTNEMNEDFFKK